MFHLAWHVDKNAFHSSGSLDLQLAVWEFAKFLARGKEIVCTVMYVKCIYP